MKVRFPWQKDSRSAPLSAPVNPATCSHPHVDVEMRGTAIKRRWCTVCGSELPVEERWNHEEQ